MPRKKKGGAGDKPESAAMTQALDEVEGTDRTVSRDMHRELARQGLSRDREVAEKTRTRQSMRELTKDESAVKEMRARKAQGGVRGKFHPSKKGQGKTVSNRSLRRDK